VFGNKEKGGAAEFWVATRASYPNRQSTFYSKLDETLESSGFARSAATLCSGIEAKRARAVRVIDPVVYLKMIMVGFFEDLPSERAIAARCADSCRSALCCDPLPIASNSHKQH